jgi:hypothetical protein
MNQLLLSVTLTFALTSCSNTNTNTHVENKTVDASIYDVVMVRSNNHATWKGYLNGSGSVSLILSFYSNGRLIEKKNMGSTVLRGKRIPFIFESTIPKRLVLANKKWDWRISFDSI